MARSKSVRRSTGRKTVGRTTAKPKPKAARRAAGRAKTSRVKAAKRSPAKTRASARKRASARPKAAAASTARRLPARATRPRLEDTSRIPTPPSSLNVNRSASAARSGRAELREHLREHTETGPVLTGGDLDANWEVAYSSGDEAPGGDNPTPDQDVVEELGRALGVEYQDNEELKGAEKLEQRDRRRWELDPASSEDYKERGRKK